MSCDLQILWDVISPALRSIYVADAMDYLQEKITFAFFSMVLHYSKLKSKPQELSGEICCVFLTLYILQCLCAYFLSALNVERNKCNVKFL